MIRVPRVRYSFRPHSYWSDDNPLVALLRNVKGEARRREIANLWEEGRLDELPAALLEDALSSGLREVIGGIHPQFMGGEYLPHSLPGECEIARICLQSTTSDAISMRARPGEDGNILYRVVDEYDAAFWLPIERSVLPLTLDQLTRQLDEGTLCDSGFGAGGLALGYNNMNADCAEDREPLRHFTSISSALYPQLHIHYEVVFDNWVKRG